MLCVDDIVIAIEAFLTTLHVLNTYVGYMALHILMSAIALSSKTLRRNQVVNKLFRDSNTKYTKSKLIYC